MKSKNLDLFEPKPMLAVQKLQLFKFLNLLDGLKAQYKIILPSGEEFGGLEAVLPKVNKRGEPRYPRLAVRNHFLPYVEKLAPGEVTEIPLGDFDIVPLGTNLSAWCCDDWGKGNSTYRTDLGKGVIELLRLA